MKYCEICAKEVTMEIVWIQFHDNEKKKKEFVMKKSL